MQRLRDGHTPELIEVFGVGRDAAAQLLITAGDDNPARLCSEAVLAALSRTSPSRASSGRINRQRLNRAGDRQANSALYHAVIVRIRCDWSIRDYVERRTE